MNRISINLTQASPTNRTIYPPAYMQSDIIVDALPVEIRVAIIWMAGDTLIPDQVGARTVYDPKKMYAIFKDDPSRQIYMIAMYPIESVNFMRSFLQCCKKYITDDCVLCVVSEHGTRIHGSPDMIPNVGYWNVHSDPGIVAIQNPRLFRKANIHVDYFLLHGIEEKCSLYEHLESAFCAEKIEYLSECKSSIRIYHTNGTALNWDCQDFTSKWYKFIADNTTEIDTHVWYERDFDALVKFVRRASGLRKLTLNVEAHFYEYAAGHPVMSEMARTGKATVRIVDEHTGTATKFQDTYPTSNDTDTLKRMFGQE